jgi:hypothetical protein
MTPPMPSSDVEASRRVGGGFGPIRHQNSAYAKLATITRAMGITSHQVRDLDSVYTGIGDVGATPSNMKFRRVASFPGDDFTHAFTLSY